MSTRSEVRFKVKVKLSSRGASFSKAKVQIKGGVKRKKYHRGVLCDIITVNFRVKARG